MLEAHIPPMVSAATTVGADNISDRRARVTLGWGRPGAWGRLTWPATTSLTEARPVLSAWGLKWGFEPFRQDAEPQFMPYRRRRGVRRFTTETGSGPAPGAVVADAGEFPQTGEASHNPFMSTTPTQHIG